MILKRLQDKQMAAAQKSNPDEKQEDIPKGPLTTASSIYRSAVAQLQAL